MGIIHSAALGTIPLRRHALRIAQAGYNAIDIRRAVRRKIRLVARTLIVRDDAGRSHRIPLAGFERIFIVGIGKGSALASATLAHMIGARLTEGIALDVTKPAAPTKRVRTFLGTHPLPSSRNIRATQAILRLTKNLTARDLVVVFICGGGSALFCGSKEEMRHTREATRVLTQQGADIIALNTVRKHLSKIKGGGFAAHLYPATVVSLLVSDVLGDDLQMIASGPTMRDTTTVRDAAKLLTRYHLTALLPHLRETPKERNYFAVAHTLLFLSSATPLCAMQRTAASLGYTTRILSRTLHGEAKHVFLPFIKKIRPNEVLLAAGETTVTLGRKLRMKDGKLGKGGRNQEAVLGTLTEREHAPDDMVIMSCASDGHDNTEAAGAIGDARILERAAALGLKPSAFLVRHDSFTFFRKTGGLFSTDKKTFNIADFMVMLRPALQQRPLVKTS